MSVKISWLLFLATLFCISCPSEAPAAAFMPTRLMRHLYSYCLSVRLFPSKCVSRALSVSAGAKSSSINQHGHFSPLSQNKRTYSSVSEMMNPTKLLLLMWETVKCRLHMTHRLTKLTRLQLDLNYINKKNHLTLNWHLWYLQLVKQCMKTQMFWLWVREKLSKYSQTLKWASTVKDNIPRPSM